MGDIELPWFGRRDEKERFEFRNPQKYIDELKYILSDAIENKSMSPDDSEFLEAEIERLPRDIMDEDRIELLSDLEAAFPLISECGAVLASAEWLIKQWRRGGNEQKAIEFLADMANHPFFPFLLDDEDGMPWIVGFISENFTCDEMEPTMFVLDHLADIKTRVPPEKRIHLEKSLVELADLAAKRMEREQTLSPEDFDLERYVKCLDYITNPELKLEMAEILRDWAKTVSVKAKLRMEETKKMKGLAKAVLTADKFQNDLRKENLMRQLHEQNKTQHKADKKVISGQDKKAL